jgi:NAD(P)-dependent dehydrogenase (short-subunit alcohol dehydrogenase family)
MTERVCLLTGASGLLGTAFIERFAGDYQIAAIHHTHPLEFATQTQMFVDPLHPSEAPPFDDRKVYSIAADLSKPRDVERAIDEVLNHFGRVDLLIHAAAVRFYSQLLSAAALERAETVFAVNVLACARLCVGLAQRFWHVDPAENVQCNRNVINISSSAGLFIYPDQGQSLYAASKAALNHLTYHLASEFWDLGIRVNAVAPDTFPGRIEVVEVLDAIRHLDGSDQTGQIVPL